MDLVTYGKRIGIPNLRDKKNYVLDYLFTTPEGKQTSYGFDAMVNDILCHPNCYKAIAVYYQSPYDMRTRALAVLDEELLDKYFIHESMAYLTTEAYQSLTIKRQAQKLNDSTD